MSRLVVCLAGWRGRNRQSGRREELLLRFDMTVTGELLVKRMRDLIVFLGGPSEADSGGKQHGDAAR